MRAFELSDQIFLPVIQEETLARPDLRVGNSVRGRAWHSVSRRTSRRLKAATPRLGGRGEREIVNLSAKINSYENLHF